MTIRSHHTLLMTGAAGGLGRAMRQRLKANCEVLRLSDIGEMDPAQAGEEVVQADLADAQAVQALVAGCADELCVSYRLPIREALTAAARSKSSTWSSAFTEMIASKCPSG